MSNKLTNPPTSPQPADHAGRFQFSLRQMFALLLAVCLALGAYTWVGVCGSIVVVIVAMEILLIQSKRVALSVALGGVTMLGLIVTFLGDGPAASRRIDCGNNLRKIGLALHNYHDRYESFPPAVLNDEQGRPMHSWRVLLLPFLGEDSLYKQYRFDEPWDGPNNRKLHTQMPRLFRCPSDKSLAVDATSYVAIVGKGTAWPTEGVRSLADFRDGTSNTLLVVESHNSGICWLEPRDLHVGQMSLRIDAKSGQGISSDHPGGAQASRADGSVRFYSEKISADELRALITVDGGEPAVAVDK